MSDDLTLNILLKGTDAVSGVVQKIASGLGPLGGIALGVVGGIATIGATSVKMAGDYEQALLKTRALANMSKDQINTLSQQILTLAPQVGQTPKQLADSLYFLASAGVPADQMLNTMRLSAEAAATGNFDAKLSADALTSAVNASGVGYKNAGNVMDELTATVTAGKMEWSDFATTVGKLASSMAQNKITTQEGYAALAQFTNSGVSARQAANQLNNTFIQLEQKTDSIAKNAKKMGVSFDETKFQSMDLQHQIAYLNDITGGHNNILLKLMNNNSVAARTVEFLRDHYTAWGGTIEQVSKSMQKGKTTQDAFTVTQEGFNQKMKEAHAALDVVFIKIGTDLLPVLDKFLNVYVIPLIQKFTDWITTSGFLKAATQDLSDVLNWLGQLVGGLATGVSDVVGWFQQAGPQGDILKTALLGIGVAIGLTKIKDFIGDLMTFATDTIPNKVIPAIAKMTGSEGLLGLKTAAQDASGTGGIGGIGPAMDSASATAKTDFAAMSEDILGVLGPLALLTVAAGQIWQKIAPKAPFPNAPTPLGPNGPVLPLNPGGTRKGPLGPTSPGASFPGFASGGFIGSGEVAFVHANEMLVPGGSRGLTVYNAQQTQGMLRGGHTFNITVNAPSGNGPDIAATVRYAIADMMRSYTPLPNITSGGRL